jgi:hypothetical protein
LDDCAKDLHHIEWHYLKQLCHSDLLTFRGHTTSSPMFDHGPGGRVLSDGYYCVAFHPGGRLIASSGGEVKSGTQLRARRS